MEPLIAATMVDVTGLSAILARQPLSRSLPGITFWGWGAAPWGKAGNNETILIEPPGDEQGRARATNNNGTGHSLQLTEST